MPSPAPTTEDTTHMPPRVNTPSPSPHTPPPSPTPPSTTPSPNDHHGYSHLPLPTLHPTDIRLISHNINTLPTTTQAELGATFDLYQAFDPTIIGIQECNRNWSLYDKTDGPTRDVIQ
jgi:hypothetical protein